MPRKIVMLTAFLLTFALAGQAAGAQPVSTIVDVDVTFTNTFDCPFPLRESFSGSYKDTLYLDAAGDPTMEILTAQYGGSLEVTWTNPANGATLSSIEAAPLLVYYNPDGSFASLQNVGLIFNVTIPGQGTVLLDAGRIDIVRHQGVVFEAGPHQEEEGDTAAFCAALA